VGGCLVSTGLALYELARRLGAEIVAVAAAACAVNILTGSRDCNTGIAGLTAAALALIRRPTGRQSTCQSWAFLRSAAIAVFLIQIIFTALKMISYCLTLLIGEIPMRRLSDIVCHKHPFTMQLTATVRDACREMCERRIGAILVTDENGKLLGIFTGRDAVGRVLAAGKSATRTKLAEVMTANPTTMPPHRTAIDALRLMWDGGFRHIPVVEDRNIAGIVSRGDFQALEADRLEEERELWEHLR
jgi:CBS domain-containing protein